MGTSPLDLQAAIDADLGYPQGDLHHFCDSSHQSVARSLLSRNILRKFLGAASPTADKTALAKFLSCNEQCKSWKPAFGRLRDELFWGTFKSVLWDFVNSEGYEIIDGPQQIFAAGDVGPGASVGVKGTDLYSKVYSSPLSSTSEKLHAYFEEFYSSHPLHVMAQASRVRELGRCKIVDGSSLSFVPKSLDVSRTIATEPLVNMIYQKGLGRLIERRLRSYWGINLETQQSVNRELARRGSIDGSLATIDLSSASDTISKQLVEQAFKGTAFLEHLRLGRCERTRVMGSTVELEMWSTMGNGYTFPLQTLIFSAVVQACFKLGMASSDYTWKQIHRSSRDGCWAVNGDDIIVPTEMFEPVCYYLRWLGFTPNLDKSFSRGWFRESCGGDFFQGVNVRSVYLTRLDEPQDVYTAINLLNAWSAKTGVSLPRTMKLLLKGTRYIPVPVHWPIDSGIRTPLEFVKQGIHTDANGSFVFKALRPVVKYLRFSKDGMVLSRRHIANPEGAYMCFLKGCIENSRIALRLPQGARPEYITRRQVSPNWDTPDPSDVESGHWRGWNSPVLINMRVPEA